MSGMKTVRLDVLAWGQILDGLTQRAEAYENTAAYWVNESEDLGQIEEVNSEAEARSIAALYRRIIADIQRELAA